MTETYRKYGDLENILVTHQGLPPLARIDHFTPAGQEYILWHDAIAEMMAYHANLTGYDIDSLIHYLIDNGFRGIRDDCNQCPLANAYIRTWSKILADRDLQATWSGAQVALSVAEVMASAGGMASTGGLRISMSFGLSTAQQNFISRFDYEEIPELEAPRK